MQNHNLDKPKVSIFKANDNIPEDEMLLAMAIQNANALCKGWCKGNYFVDKDGCPVLDYEEALERSVKCCASGICLLTMDTKAIVDKFTLTHQGNDNEATWSYIAKDEGESYGWTYRQAMTDD